MEGGGKGASQSGKGEGLMVLAASSAEGSEGGGKDACFFMQK